MEFFVKVRSRQSGPAQVQFYKYINTILKQDGVEKEAYVTSRRLQDYKDTLAITKYIIFLCNYPLRVLFKFLKTC